MAELVIRNASFVDGKKCDIYIKDKVIQKISPKLDMDIPTLQLDDDCYISAGWIDAHTHCFEKFEIYADHFEEIGYKKGVCVVVDAGTAGADNIDEFYQSTRHGKTHVYSLLNISKTGIYAQNELADMSHIDQDAFVSACQKYPHFIIGVKARMSKSVVGNNGDAPLFQALQIAQKVNLPLMVHIGTAPSQLETVLQNLRSHDIVTHIFNPKSNGILDEHHHIKPCVFEAIQKQIYFDLGHGTDSFSFDVCKTAFHHHVPLYTISSDIYHRNRQNGPVYDLATTMSKLYACGYPLTDIIEDVTAHPAKMFHLQKRGVIQEGYIGEFTIFKVVQKDKDLIDSTGQVLHAHAYIEPIGIIINDEYIDLKEKENGKCL